VLHAEPLPADVRELLVTIQRELFNLGGELSIPGIELLKADAVLRLDEALARYHPTLPRLAEFTLPAGTCSAAPAHLSRTIARRAERALVLLAGAEQVNDAPRQYLNRLSDLEFVLARVLNRGAEAQDALERRQDASGDEPAGVHAATCGAGALAEFAPGQPTRQRPVANDSRWPAPGCHG
jgi:ATP:cob(I)alamin adenosyltransferase